MASYSTIKRGSRGDDVERLQTLLNNAGYSLDVDGIFGDNTYNAVRQYQRANRKVFCRRKRGRIMYRLAMMPGR